MLFNKKKTKKMPLPSMLPPPYIWDVYYFPNGIKKLITEIQADTEEEAKYKYSTGPLQDKYLMFRCEFQVNLKKTKEILEQIEKEKKRRNQGMWWNND